MTRQEKLNQFKNRFNNGKGFDKSLIYSRFRTKAYELYYDGISLGYMPYSTLEGSRLILKHINDYSGIYKAINNKIRLEQSYIDYGVANNCNTRTIFQQ